jgi:hypothetical protein
MLRRGKIKEKQRILFNKCIYDTLRLISIVTDLLKAFLCNSSVHMFLCATMETVSHWMNVAARC